MEYVYHTVDVFTQTAFSGAAVSVFPKASGLDAMQMQLIAKEMNHSETVFIFPGSGEVAAELRVFSPAGERVVGSHSVVAAARTLVHSQELPVEDKDCVVQFSQGRKVFRVVLSMNEGRLLTQLSMSVSPQIDHYVPDNRELEQVLGLGSNDIETLKARTLFVSCDSPYLIVPLRSMDAVYRARFNLEAWSRSSAASVAVNEVLVYSSETESLQTDFHLRILGEHIAHDASPPVGAAIPAFVASLCESRGLADGTHTLWLERGFKANRQSVLQVEFVKKATAELKVRVGGDAVLVAQGTILAPDVKTQYAA
ncbi:putative isomerase YddE [Zhongshania aliphaticivorans]|uniref:Putative isomerase YddE n=1 Tax=Zhongshania aliphaticivorans TaxID=1470434 RepID=A0A5S9NVH7_9GAMM|nr:PhzF family phenazine biosynthesis protein [Zhongshania aliphaticivorans]CAA0088613.1 putative isomerase YddE [Zhongshania aliphaticivorans]CAA0094748.1 putative isomerase YddE [Zhongshania aliphaticivorans]